MSSEEAWVTASASLSFSLSHAAHALGTCAARPPWACQWARAWASVSVWVSASASASPHTTALVEAPSEAAMACVVCPSRACVAHVDDVVELTLLTLLLLHGTEHISALERRRDAKHGREHKM